MGNKVKKAKRILEVRTKFYNDLCLKLGGNWIKANKKPGSLKYK